MLLASAWAFEHIDVCNGQPTRWTLQPSSWKLTKPPGQPIYSLLTDAEVNLANNQGWDVWSDTVSCCSGWDHLDAGTTPVAFNTQDAENVVAFEEGSWDPAFGSVNVTIAITVPVYFTNNCVIVNADQLYNAVGFDFSVVANPGPNQTDLQSIMAHENGHWLGLGHSSTGAATMFASYSGGTGLRTLDTDDESGVCDSHPGNCGDQEVCDNNLDDDADGQVDCDDANCASFPGCSCPVVGVVGCDASIVANNSEGGNTVDSYSCTEFPLTGPETVYTFIPGEDGPVTVTLSGLSADLDLIVSTESDGSCEADNCLASSNADLNDETLTFNGFGGVTYAVVADGYDGAVSNFTLTTSCPEPQGGGECSTELAPIGCDSSVSGSNFGFENDVQDWGCVGWQTTGPEAVYEFSTPTDRDVTLNLSGLTADLDLFVSDKVGLGCSESACLAVSGNSDADSENVTFTARAGTTYMVVADGWDGASSNFNLDVTCAAPSSVATPTDGSDPVNTGCSTSGAPWSLWGLLLPLALIGRRRAA